MTKKRTDASYEIEALSKGLLVLEALEGSGFEPVPIARVVHRTGLPKDTVYRSLRTLRLRGYATTNDRGEWTIGNRFLRLRGEARQAKGQI